MDTATVTSSINAQTFLDLGAWLSPYKEISSAQEARLLDEAYYLDLIALANQYWLIGPLAHQLQQHQIWPTLPEQLSSYLQTLEQIYLQRSLDIQQEVIHVATLLTKANVDLVLMKGSACLFNGSYQPISTRFMSDIDVLVPKLAIDRAQGVLNQAGFEHNFGTFDLHRQDHHHAPALIRENGICYVELHRSALKKAATTILSTSAIWNKAQLLVLTQGLTVKQLHPTHQIIHSIVHSEISDRGFAEKHIEIRQLLNLVMIAKHFNEQICWLEIEKHFEQKNQVTVLHATLYNAYRLFNFSTPITITNNNLELNFNACLDRFIKHQGNDSRLDLSKHIFLGYQADTIISLYGSKGLFPVLTGRIKHAIRHFKLTIIVLLKYLGYKQQNPRTKKPSS
ncbi:nucleotidyltransferase family protein [Thalassotalea atypica]|uniref:nucleotidyltransferase family protein n=1 Tax=Thalassotalea atypica TaxID=2054316 RepID=UPI0025745664|nr:nucleotidyltransferase family protein [Thalassotalea atypica]